MNKLGIPSFNDCYLHVNESYTKMVNRTEKVEKKVNKTENLTDQNTEENQEEKEEMEI